MSKKLVIPSSKGPSKKRIILFKGISIILVPLIILCLIEFGLRLFHYGNNVSLFVEYGPDKEYLVFNPDASKRYFTDNNFATTGNLEPFKKKKDNNTIRIFVLGESTTIGYPYFHNGSFHRWLQYRLMHTFPDKNFEIINLSLTAVNSYTVLGFAKEVVNYQPDAVLIYTGHNEFYGALGAASTQHISSNRFIVNLILDLRELKLAQLITNLYERLRGFHNNDKAEHSETRMQLMATNQEIRYQSALYTKGVNQFKTNMDAVLNLFNTHHIPVFLSNLVSNEKDLKPFISFEPNGALISVFKRNYSMGLKAFNNNDFAGAYHYLNQAEKQYNNSAFCNYYLGRVCFAKGDFEQARQYFLKAQDLDGLRFRAPEEFNTILTKLCLRYPNTHLVDTKGAFESYADHHIIGNELILDHVHPDLKGYAIMSDAFYNELRKTKVLPDGDLANEMSFRQLLQSMPVSRTDSIAGMDRIFNLKSHWPYNDPTAKDSIKADNAEQTFAYELVFNKASWNVTMNSLYIYYVGYHRYKEARDVVESLILEDSGNEDLYEKAAALDGTLKDYKSTLYNFKKSFALSPSFDKARYIFVLYLKCDQPDNAIPYIDYGISNNTSGLNLNNLKAFTENVIQLKRSYLTDSTNVKILNQIASTYLSMDNQDGAEKYIKKASKINPENYDTKLLISKLNNLSVKNEHK
ncbi:tetratricopeptide repeat protein [Mucilaginibacter sp.]